MKNNTVEIKYAVEHSGRAHMDDAISTGIVSFMEGRRNLPFYRRNPTEAELADPGVIVFDVGLRYEPLLRNFDHHQSAGMDCAAWLLAQHYGIQNQDLAWPWWTYLNNIDVVGPYKTATKMNMPASCVFTTQSPLEEALLKAFENTGPEGRVNPEVVGLLYDIMSYWMGKLGKLSERLDWLEEHAVVTTVEGVKGIMVWEAVPDPSFGVTEYREKMGEDWGWSITPSDREGESWCLYRYEDHPRVDFRRLAGEKGVEFIHPGGFIAKLKEGINKWRAAALLGLAISRE